MDVLKHQMQNFSHHIQYWKSGSEPHTESSGAFDKLDDIIQSNILYR